MNTVNLRYALLCCVLAARLAAADAPTREEWDPVVQAVAAGSDQAAAKLSGITSRYPAWPDGWIERARLSLSTRHPDEAWKYAREALSLQRGNGEAAALGVQALTALGRPGDGLKVAEAFKNDRTLDKQANGKVGYVNYYAAYAALAAKDPAKARDHLASAMACAGAAVPAEFHVLDARIAIVGGDLAKAEASLGRATTLDPRNWDGWYELGRVRHALAEAEAGAGGKRTWLEGAERAFATVTKAIPDDYESWLGLGRAQAALARLEIDGGSDGGGHLRDAVASLGEAVKRHDDLVAGWVTLGEAQVRLGSYAEAAAALAKARTLGANEPAVLHNLALALQKSGHAEESLAILKDTVASSGSELVSQGMGYYHNHFYAAAIERLEAGAAHADLAGDPRTRGQVLRFVGHAWREWGDGIGADGKPAAAPLLPQEREQRRAKAADAYRRAGDLGDVMAQRHYAAFEAENGPQAAYAAGWTVLGWNRWLSGQGWGLVIANYGAARAWDKPLHYVIWGLLIGLPLLLWVKSLFRPAVVAPEERPRDRPAPEPTPRPASRPPREAPPQIRTPAPKREVDPLTARKDRPAPAPRGRVVTTEDEGNGRPAGRASEPGGKRRSPLPETEEIVAPAKPRSKPR